MHHVLIFTSKNLNYLILSLRFMKSQLKIKEKKIAFHSLDFSNLIVEPKEIEQFS